MSKPAGTQQSFEPVSARPVKAFFVTMFTRDIPLADAILDLLDNCVDGVLRAKGKAVDSYKGYYAEITFDASHFMIHDNCGGIPWALRNYAFRLGAPPDQPRQDLPTVGVYGVGMKRAIFKMGRHCFITTKNRGDEYEIEITPEWLDDEQQWNLPLRAASHPLKEAGTTILISELYDGISKTFGDGGAAFHAELFRRVAEQYAFIISKGFEVRINTLSVDPRPTKLAFRKPEARRRASDEIAPFVYRTRVDGVAVFLAIGLTRAIPTAEEIADEDSGGQGRYKSLAAGWTVVCNDRAVIYCDRTELTGWGEDDIPRYHTQFIAISGIVEFRSADASKLPTTTTKRGIDAASPLYLQVKNKMREGLKLFTTYTYWWKGRESEARGMVDKVPTLSFSELKSRVSELPMRTVTRVPGGEQFKPKLPRPRAHDKKTTRISFERPLVEVRAVAGYLFKDSEVRPSKVGEECFKTVLREARR